jgi:hypothetical protein
MHKIQKNVPIALQLQIPKLEQQAKLVRIERCDLRWAQQIAVNLHYLHRQVHDLAHTFAYAILDNATRQAVGMLMLATPHFTKCREMFGYSGLPTKWQVLLSRVWVEPNWQTEVSRAEDGSLQLSGPVVVDSKGKRHSLCIASCAIAQMLRQVNRDWLEHHPPRYPDQPYNLERILSYCDPAQGHTGVLYKAANFTEFHRQTHGKQPIHRHSTQRDRGSSRKYVYFYNIRLAKRR